MHTTRRALRRFARSLNPCDDFKVSFAKRGVLGPDPRPATLNENDAAAAPPSWNISGQGLVRNSALSRTFARDFATSVRKEPPEPRGLPLFGTLPFLIAAGGPMKLHEYVDKRHRELGPVYREQIGPVRSVFVKSPDEYRKILIDFAGPYPQHFLPEAWKLYNEIRVQHRGLLFMDGEEWWYHRKIVNQAMLKPSPMMFLCTPCQEVAENLTNKWKTYSQAGKVIPNLEHQLYQWSIEVTLATLMGSRWRGCEPQIRSEIEFVALLVHRVFKYSVPLMLIPPKVAMKLRLPVWTKFVKTVDAVLDKIHKLMPQIIQHDNDGLLKVLMSHGIGEDKIARIVTDLIMAAGDTTSVTLRWTLLMLCNHPELQDQLFHDIKDLPLEEILQSQLLRNIGKETLRLYPVAPFLTRYLQTDATIGGYFVPKGELIIISLYSSSRDENNFPRPNDFWPERWVRLKESLRDHVGVRDARASVPFSAGLRNCVGRKLAETQLSLTLAQIIKNFKIECENRDSIKMILQLISVPSEPLKLKLTDRKIS
ncbi:PREDICTED: cytochrome P450 315a1, mitochondrial [Vollenhovia emeryi]|uniref:cytochrome P450 315a1, mitochondrial n=1 Tax=Vollenhovia emeryi TaxID=411798 RepID=UPI0005F43D33|nr:PREDICTED: cytochrome P450 315a1, mitochondrial [Vollenhovia emeryi]XP_011873849.1 PREDICTED: cytochrome P450 315a1, mitochondrial [Vollenhovia emeryi]